MIAQTPRKLFAHLEKGPYTRGRCRCEAGTARLYPQSTRLNSLASILENAMLCHNALHCPFTAIAVVGSRAASSA